MRKNRTHHLDRIEFAVKLGQENTFMASLPNHTFEHRNLVREIILFTENVRHAAIIVLKWTDWCAFGTNVASGFLFRRHCGDVRFRVQVKYFIVSLPHDEKIWNVVNTLRLSKGSDCALFQIFPITFKDFRQNFMVHFLICPFSQERLDESYWNLATSFA